MRLNNQEIQKLLSEAEANVKRLQQKGWSKKNFAKSLKKELTEPT